MAKDAPFALSQAAAIFVNGFSTPSHQILIYGTIQYLPIAA
jgi:hypothetical protein